jgi:3-deoxy-D-manno-octulosonic-acid transferase
MFILYDLIFIIFALFYLPVYFLRRKFHSGFLMRLGIFPEKRRKEFSGKRPIWLHAVSVGEALASRSLLESLHREYPKRPILISTVTPTGNRIARSLAGEKDAAIYLPLDISFIVNRVLSFIKPSLFIIAETEIWPNLISSLRKRKVPIIVVNARISDGSYKGYRLIKFSLRHILRKINLFCVQTETDCLRLLSLGVEKEKIKITGNMKFDNTDYTDKRNTDYADKYRSTLELKQNDRLLVAGSTHPGEEEIILAAYRDLLTEFPELRLLIAPRHPERSGRLESIIQKFGFQTARISQLEALKLAKSPSKDKQQGNKQSVFLLDTIGRLMYFYAIADIVFVGGSLIKKGGHNILEPAVFAKPVLFGPWTFNFRDITSLFLKHKASFLVRNQGELKEGIKNLLLNPAAAQELSQRAKELIGQNQGATKRNLEYIRQYLHLIKI